MLHTTHKYSVHGAHTHKGMHTPSHNNYWFATRLGYNAKGRREDLMLFLVYLAFKYRAEARTVGCHSFSLQWEGRF